MPHAALADPHLSRIGHPKATRHAEPSPNRQQPAFEPRASRPGLRCGATPPNATPSFRPARRPGQHYVVVLEGLRELPMPGELGDTGRPQPAERPFEYSHATIAGEPRHEYESVRLRNAAMDRARQGSPGRMVAVVRHRAPVAHAYRPVATRIDQRQGRVAGDLFTCPATRPRPFVAH